MRHPLYLLRRHYSAVIATLALVVALTSAGAWAGTVLVGSKQIRNGSILTQDIHKAAVKSSDIGGSAVQSTDIKTGAVEGSDIGAGEVEPQDVTMPEPEQIQEAGVAAADVGDAVFVLVDEVGTYIKEDPAAEMQVDWSGTAESPFGVDCIFQLRVDGQASAAGAGAIFVPSGAPESVSTTALFSGLSVGPHQIQVWARAPRGGPTPDTRCIVGPSRSGIPQTFIVSEQVV